MNSAGYLLLTGATGLLGRYLLRELLVSGQRVAVLVRDGRSARAEERIEELTATWSDTLRTHFDRPVVLTGDLSDRGLGLSVADHTWLAKHCRRVVHAAANVALRRSANGDPWQTNVGGTQHLLYLCQALGIGELHHVSTAFVCGDRAGPVAEEELDCGQGFHNDYERSKFEAERRVRTARGLRPTVYRPSVIVGDSVTGFTSSYHGPYRFLELGTRLAAPPRLPGSPQRLPLRLPFSGDEPRNLVPVDWVARAIVRIVGQPWWHGRTYHLVARQPTRMREIKDVAAKLLGIDGVEWTRPGQPFIPGSLEERFQDQLQEYWPYLHGDPTFEYWNTLGALPRLPPPRVDAALLARLIRFAMADGWGRPGRKKAATGAAVDCAHYVEQFLPDVAQRSVLADLPLEATIGLTVSGLGGGQWSVALGGAAPVVVRRGAPARPEATYRMDRGTFAALVRGRLTPQDAFLARRIEIAGDMEKGLFLATLFGRLAEEFPYRDSTIPEVADVSPVLV